MDRDSGPVRGIRTGAIAAVALVVGLAGCSGGGRPVSPRAAGSRSGSHGSQATGRLAAGGTPTTVRGTTTTLATVSTGTAATSPVAPPPSFFLIDTTGNIDEISTATGRVLRTLGLSPAAGIPADLAVAPDWTRLFVVRNQALKTISDASGEESTLDNAPSDSGGPWAAGYPAVSQDGTKVAWLRIFAGNCGGMCHQNVEVTDVVSGQSVAISGMLPEPRDLSWSGDGSSVVMQTNGGYLITIPSHLSGGDSTGQPYDELTAKGTPCGPGSYPMFGYGTGIAGTATYVTTLNCGPGDPAGTRPESIVEIDGQGNVLSTDFVPSDSEFPGRVSVDASGKYFLFELLTATQGSEAVDGLFWMYNGTVTQVPMSTALLQPGDRGLNEPVW